MGLVCTGLALAPISQGVRTEQEEIQQDRETNTEDFGAQTACLAFPVVVFLWAMIQASSNVTVTFQWS